MLLMYKHFFFLALWVCFIITFLINLFYVLFIYDPKKKDSVYNMTKFEEKIDLCYIILQNLVFFFFIILFLVKFLYIPTEYYNNVVIFYDITSFIIYYILLGIFSKIYLGTESFNRLEKEILNVDWYEFRYTTTTIHVKPSYNMLYHTYLTFKYLFVIILMMFRDLFYYVEILFKYIKILVIKPLYIIRVFILLLFITIYVISEFFCTTILISIIFKTLKVLVPLLVSIDFYTLFERKAMAAVQRRKGPNITGIWGFLQPLADGLKLLIKEIVIPRRSNFFFYVLAPFLTFFLSLLGWVVIPFGTFNTIANINYSVLFVLAVSSLGVYGVILAGWSSNSKYALLGSIRAAAQMISYELCLSLAILPVIMLTGSLSLSEISYIQNERGIYLFPLLPSAIIFFISILAETNRAPFDMAESEAEIVAGYNLEYSSMTFALFFLGEYSNMLLMSSLFVIFFLGGAGSDLLIYNVNISPIIFSFKIIIICFLFILVRAMLPRYRYDQLMSVGWKVMLPLSLSYVIFCASLIFLFDINTVFHL